MTDAPPPPERLAARLPDVEWAHRAAADELDGVNWVELRLDPSLTTMRQTAPPKERPQFRQGSYLRFLPPSIADAALAAQAKGRVTGWEALQLVFARLEWMIRGRRHLWAPYGPVPRLLAGLVEAYGVEREIHKFDPTRLGRLAALLPGWHPYRGTVERAREVLSACDEQDLLDNATGGTSADAAKVKLRDEIFACRSLAFWSTRADDDSKPEYRITKGYLRFQPARRDGFALKAEDVLIQWQPGRPLPKDAVRLLPAWTVVRLTASTGRN